MLSRVPLFQIFSASLSQNVHILFLNNNIMEIDKYEQLKVLTSTPGFERIINAMIDAYIYI